ncbi:unknown protein [Seminavis robusta]|uniref:Uncharacterized protein n=1 Tax=Seminavis robusta TaxID=568900 RepID=A0A9N8E1F4_9STRA|nr:unknown protein [Seminavis robusta]|eukprot:Sro554_g165590.1 n/a (643) ;mRNA; r:57144-59072
MASEEDDDLSSTDRRVKQALDKRPTIYDSEDDSDDDDEEEEEEAKCNNKNNKKKNPPEIAEIDQSQQMPPLPNYCSQPTQDTFVQDAFMYQTNPEVRAQWDKANKEARTAAWNMKNPPTTRACEGGVFSRDLPFTPTPDIAKNLALYQSYLLSTGTAGGSSGSSQPDPTIQRVVANAEAALTPAARKRVSSQEKEQQKAAKKQAREKKKEDDRRKKEAEKAKQLEMSKEIDALVDRFQPDYRKCIKCQDEKHPKNKNDETDYSVAKYFVMKEGKPDEKRYDLATFNHQQLRILCQKARLKGAGGFSMWKARCELASWINSGTIYMDNSIANPFTSAQDRRQNTYIRLIQGCFLTDNNMVYRFCDLNDRHKRMTFEKNQGQSAVKVFFVELSEVCNDTSMNGKLSKIIRSDDSKEDCDPYLVEWVKNEDFNIADFEQQTYETAMSKVLDVMKARELALGGMRKSGNNDSDFWTYATNQKYLKWRVSGAPIPAKAVYYCHVLCQQYPQIDGRFSDVLEEEMKSDSNVPMIGSAGGGSDSSGSAKKTQRELLRKMEEVKQQQQQHQKDTIAQRQEYINLQKEELKRSSAREQWKEYTSMAKEFKAWKQENDDDNEPMLQNMAIHITRELEKQLNIPEERTVTTGF